MTVHVLKTWPEAFAAILAGEKRHEYRRDDRTPGFAVGDWLELVEYDPATGSHTDRCDSVRVTYVGRGPAYGIPAGYVVMSIVRVDDAPIQPVSVGDWNDLLGLLEEAERELVESFLPRPEWMVKLPPARHDERALHALVRGLRKMREILDKAAAR